MAKNTNLNAAGTAKNDEFYTRLTDIEKELKNYKEHFNGKTILCNCDNPSCSNFVKYFSLHFDGLGLKKLIATSYTDKGTSCKLEIYKDETGMHKETQHLEQNGDFRNPENIELLKESDIIVTNPPFSLFREYVAQLIEYGKKFLIIGSMNAITYKDIFQLLKSNTIWLGINHGAFEFMVPDTYDKEIARIKPDGIKYARLCNITWYTNLDNHKRHENIDLHRIYNETDYPKYDDYDAVNVNAVVDIPCDHDGKMGVPITFFTKYNPEQFEILGLDCYMPDNPHQGKRFTINGKSTYARILIQKRKIR